MTAINKWNGKVYTVLSMSVNTIELQRPDGSEFEIQKSEFYFNYRVIEEEEEEEEVVVEDEAGKN